jgi:hypothetical protein
LVSNPSLRWFPTTYGIHYLKESGSPTGGMRVIVAGGMNSVLNTIERTGLMTPDPDSVGTANTDTMAVWEKLNLHKTGASRVVFSTFGSIMEPDSISSADLGDLANIGGQPEWPTLMVAVAHLDSLANGLVLGGKKRPGIGFVLTHGGGRSSRMHPGGIFSADTTHLSTSADSIRMAGIPVVIAADPESLAVNAGDIAILKKMGGRFTPYVRAGIDTLALPASGGSTAALPRDVWGRYRNRTVYGPSSDTGSVVTGLLSAKRSLAALVGADRMSATAIAPDFDWTPYQVRNGRNQILVDSLMWGLREIGFSALAVLTLGRDSDPHYKTNPAGWLDRERKYTISAPSKRGMTVNILGVANAPTWGSSKFIGRPAQTDTVPPYCDPICPGPNVSVDAENQFWAAYFTAEGSDFVSHRGLKSDNDGYSGIYFDSRLRLYPRKRSSLCVLPIQSLGGGAIDFGPGHIPQATPFPTRPGWLVMKHISMAVKAANQAAGRTVIKLAYPEDIEP